MKTFFALFLVVTSVMVQSQNTAFVDYLLDLQSGTQPYYDSMLMTFSEARRELSGHLRDLNTAGVLEITNAMYRIISIRDETQPFIDEAIGGEECLRVTAANWQRDLDNSGIRIASCGNDALAQINNATENFQSYIAEQSLVAFGAQNFILDVLSEVNTITDLTNISPFVYSSVVEIYEPFHFEAIPEFERLLQVFVDLKDTVPIEISECVTATTSRLEDEAWVLRNTLEFC